MAGASGSGKSPLRFEMFAVALAPPEDLWALVGDPRRAPEWTDAEEVVPPPEPPLAVGARFSTRDGDRRREWVVITAGDRLLEVKTDDCEMGRIGLGVRVTADPAGSRLVMAGMLDPIHGGLRARTVDLPSLRRRCERWMDVATKAVRRPGT